MKAKCSVGECDRHAHAKGLCTAHYRRLLKGEPLDGPIKFYQTARGRRAPCSAPGCPRHAMSKGLCERHRQRQRAGIKDWDKPIAEYGCESDITVSTKVSSELLEVLDRQCKRQKITRAQLLRIIIETWRPD